MAEFEPWCVVSDRAVNCTTATAQKGFALKILIIPGHGHVVNVFTFYSDDPNSNPAEVYNSLAKLLLKRTKINKKRPQLPHITSLVSFKGYCFFNLPIVLITLRLDSSPWEGLVFGLPPRCVRKRYTLYS